MKGRADRKEGSFIAYLVEVTLGTGNRVSANYKSQEVSVSITYQLDPDDRDVLAVIGEKAREPMATYWHGSELKKENDLKGWTGQLIGKRKGDIHREGIHAHSKGGNHPMHTIGRKTSTAIRR